MQAMDSQRVVLHFGAVDYEADVFVNGCHVTNHQGGHTSFEVDITDYLVDGQQAISVRAFDPHADESIPRGNNSGRQNLLVSGIRILPGFGSQYGWKSFQRLI